jgi:hypothetical protein
MALPFSISAELGCNKLKRFIGGETLPLMKGRSAIGVLYIEST